MVGKGFFNLFVASMCLLGDTGFFGYFMCFGLIICGIFFILIGCACLKGYDEAMNEPMQASTFDTEKQVSVGLDCPKRVKDITLHDLKRNEDTSDHFHRVD